MYVRQFAYTIVPGHEEKAVALCERFVRTLRGCGVEARILVGGPSDSTLQVVEEYDNLAAMDASRAALERDDTYRGALSAWAVAFYPLVRATVPAIVLHAANAA